MEGGPPVFSADSTCPQILLLRIGRFRFRIRDSHTLRFNFPFDSPTVPNPCLRTTPPVFLPEVWPLPISLATTFGISFDFFSSAYLDVSVRRVPFANLWIQLTILDSSSRGFPHSDIRGSMFISNSPRLFAGNHVLRRLSVPRHSPYALFRLNSFARSHKFRSCLSFANNCWVVMKRPFFRTFFITVFHHRGFPRRRIVVPSFGKTFYCLPNYNYLFVSFLIRFSMNNLYRIRSQRIGCGVGADLFSRAVTGKVSSALRSLTSVFGMGTGGPSGIRYRLSETTVPEN